jgi:hypothetical protein
MSHNFELSIRRFKTMDSTLKIKATLPNMYVSKSRNTEMVPMSKPNPC